MEKKSFNPGTLLAPLPCVMVSCSDGQSDNIITIAWTGIINSVPPMTYISMRPERHSYEMIKNSGEFVINMVNKDLVFAMDHCGCRTGAKENKFETMHLHKAKADLLSCPMIEEAPFNLECRLTEIKHLGSHDMFIAEIVAVHADEQYVCKDGRIAYEKAGLVCFTHQNYYALDPKSLGSYGYSVMKPSTVKRRRAENKPTGGRRPHWEK